MQRRCGRLATAVGLSMVMLVGLWACQSSSPPPLELSNDWQQRDWIPILDEEPLPDSDVRNLENCAEYPFKSPVRGPWDSADSKELVEQSDPQHRTSDFVTGVGDTVRLNANMAYENGPLEREWVRLFIGSCDGWEQVGVRKTEDDGEVVFRLPRQKAGIYGVIFQVVGDQTKIRSQLWVAPEDSEVVAFDLDGAAYESGAVMKGAPTLSRWHTGQGRLVVYVDGDNGEPVENWRRKLRDSGFAVGPILKLVADAEQAEERATDNGQNGWGESGNGPKRSPAISMDVSTFYTGSNERIADFRAAGLKIVDAILRTQACPIDDEADDSQGWQCLITELAIEEDDDDPG